MDKKEGNISEGGRDVFPFPGAGNWILNKLKPEELRFRENINNGIIAFQMTGPECMNKNYESIDSCPM